MKGTATNKINDFTIISKLIDEANQASKMQSDVLSELNKGNIDTAIEMAYRPIDLDKALHTFALKIANKGPNLTKAAFMHLASTNFAHDFATKVGYLAADINKQLNKALTDFLGTYTEYKSGSIIIKDHIPSDKASELNNVLQGNKIISTRDDEQHARELTKVIEDNYYDKIKSWYEHSPLVHHDTQTTYACD